MSASPVPARVGLEAEWSVLGPWIDALPDATLERPSVLTGWTVGELVAHLGRAVSAVTRAEPAPAAAERLTVARYYGPAWGDAELIAQSARDAATASSDVRAALDDAVRSTLAVLDGADERSLVLARRGAVTLGDLAVTRTLELVVHGDDLARSVPEVAPPAHARDALRDVVKLLLGVLTERAPGRSVEVRVPPFAAVQCVEGTSHTRGTPPNTVEADALTWVRVACGRVAWADAVADGSLRASGVRADEVAAHLPLL